MKHKKKDKKLKFIFLIVFLIVFGILTALYFFGGGNFSSFSILQIRQSGITGAAVTDALIDPITGEKIPEIIEKTSNSETIKIADNKFQASIYPETRFAQNSLGEWVDASDIMSITRNEDDITFHYDGIEGYFNLTFESGVIYNKNYFSMAQVKQANPQITFDFPTQKTPEKIKYAVNISNIPLEVQPNVEYVTLTYKSHYGFTLSELKSEQGKFIAKNLMGFAFDDLKESYYTININTDEKRIYIGNLSGYSVSVYDDLGNRIGETAGSKFVNNALYLDPTSFLASGTSTWVVPSDWNNNSNSIASIGPGGNGGTGDNTADIAGAGGGGGAYANVSNVKLIADSTVYVRVPSGGSQLTAYFNNNTNVSVLVADYGRNAAGATDGNGGWANQSTGTVTYDGGSGGTADGTSANRHPGGGGGGSAGKFGAGKAGGAGSTETAPVDGAAGGGGSNGGSSTAGSTTTGNNGAAGGAGTGGTGGGAGGTSGGNGTAGTSGGGGGGGASTSSTRGAGAAGGCDTSWNTTLGACGGGGGSGTTGGSGGDGGNGGTYGGGGGGGGQTQTGGAGANGGAAGTGGAGLIVITYAVDTCTYSSSPWEIDLSQNCVITGSQGASTAKVFVTGTGTLTIDGGVIVCDRFYFMPDTLNDVNSLKIINGGRLSCVV